MTRREFKCASADCRHGRATRLHEGHLIRNMAAQIIASIILFQSSTGVAEEAAIPSDHNFVDELVSELGFQPADLIERIRQLSNLPSEAAMQHRLSYCVQGYADRIATDANLREKIASEVEERTCAQLGLCRERDQQRTDQSSLYAELLRVVAVEMRAEKRADSSKVFQEHARRAPNSRQCRWLGSSIMVRQNGWVVSWRHFVRA